MPRRASGWRWGRAACDPLADLVDGLGECWAEDAQAVADADDGACADGRFGHRPAIFQSDQAGTLGNRAQLARADCADEPDFLGEREEQSDVADGLAGVSCETEFVERAEGRRRRREVIADRGSQHAVVADRAGGQIPRREVTGLDRSIGVNLGAESLERFLLADLVDEPARRASAIASVNDDPSVVKIVVHDPAAKGQLDAVGVNSIDVERRVVEVGGEVDRRCARRGVLERDRQVARFIGLTEMFGALVEPSLQPRDDEVLVPGRRRHAGERGQPVLVDGTPILWNRHGRRVRHAFGA